MHQMTHQQIHAAITGTPVRQAAQGVKGTTDSKPATSRRVVLPLEAKLRWTPAETAAFLGWSTRKYYERRHELPPPVLNGRYVQHRAVDIRRWEAEEDARPIDRPEPARLSSPAARAARDAALKAKRAAKGAAGGSSGGSAVGVDPHDQITSTGAGVGRRVSPSNPKIEPAVEAGKP
jgi:hypothetical protein